MNKIVLFPAISLLTGVAHAGLDDYKDRLLPAAAAEPGKKSLSVTFLGVATLLLRVPVEWRKSNPFGTPL